IVGWAMIDPKIAPPLPEEQTRVNVPEWIKKLQALYAPNLFVALAKAMVSPARARKLEIDGKPMGYLAIAQNFLISLVPFLIAAGTLATVWWYVVIHQQAGAASEAVEGLQQLGSAAVSREATPAEQGPGLQFYIGFAITTLILGAWSLRSYLRMDAERF